jgi:hypothetical protein
VFRIKSCVLTSSDQGVEGYPMVKIYQANSINGTKVPYFSLHPFQVLRMVGIVVDNYDDIEESSSSSTTNIKRDSSFRKQVSDANIKNKNNPY